MMIPQSLPRPSQLDLANAKIRELKATCRDLNRGTDRQHKRILELEAAATVALSVLVKLSEESDCNIDPFTFGRWGGNVAIQKIQALKLPPKR